MYTVEVKPVQFGARPPGTVVASGLIFTQHRAAINGVSDPGYPPIINLTGA
jgi:hypothetical protein